VTTVTVSVQRVQTAIEPVNKKIISEKHTINWWQQQAEKQQLQRCFNCNNKIFLKSNNQLAVIVMATTIAVVMATLQAVISRDTDSKQWQQHREEKHECCSKREKLINNQPAVKEMTMITASGISHTMAEQSGNTKSSGSSISKMQLPHHQTEKIEVSIYQ